MLTEDGQSGSAFFGSLPRELLQAVQEEPLAMENHRKGGKSWIKVLSALLILVVCNIAGRTLVSDSGQSFMRIPLQPMSSSIGRLLVAEAVKGSIQFRLCYAGLGVKKFNSSEALQEFFKVVSLSKDRQNVTYISTLEGRKVRWLLGSHLSMLLPPEDVGSVHACEMEDPFYMALIM